MQNLPLPALGCPRGFVPAFLCHGRAWGSAGLSRCVKRCLHLEEINNPCPEGQQKSQGYLVRAQPSPPQGAAGVFGDTVGLSNPLCKIQPGLSEELEVAVGYSVCWEGRGAFCAESWLLGVLQAAGHVLLLSALRRVVVNLLKSFIFRVFLLSPWVQSLSVALSPVSFCCCRHQIISPLHPPALSQRRSSRVQHPRTNPDLGSTYL